jgi:aryl-alcohol dehydrogenase-like predicted oxidoreductase
MEFRKLGTTGLDVSRICFGSMGFGLPSSGEQTWHIDEHDARLLVKQAVDLGINFFDTANVYSNGTSEEILGRALKEYAHRDEIVVATKVFNAMRKGPNAGGLSRKAILPEVDHSLRRLGTDYIDLYQIHRWDYATPIEETMEALHDVVKAGKVRYLGASAMYAWQFSSALRAAEQHGWTRFVSMQNHYNLIYREEEREMLPLCQAAGVAAIPYSPLAGGLLARDSAVSTMRSKTDAMLHHKYDKMLDYDRSIVERVGELANKHGVSRAQVALAWILQQKVVCAPIVGVTKAHHLEDAVAALAITLSSDEIAYLEEPYVPHPVVGALPPSSR